MTSSNRDILRILKAPEIVICSTCDGWGDLITKQESNTLSGPIKINLNLCLECSGVGMNSIPLSEVL